MKRRVRERQTHEVTGEVRRASLCVRRWERYWGGEAEGRAAWEELGTQLVAEGNLTRRPSMFWRYTADVPDALRGDGSVESNLDRELDGRRVRWLLGDGKHHQRQDDYALRKGGEAAALYRTLERLARATGTPDG